MRFSFLMCVHQDQPFLLQAIESMVNQNYEFEYEIIIVANGCEDFFYTKLVSFCENINKIRLYRTSIGQLAFNLNYGFDLAKGEYVVRMDADDICLPDRLVRTAEMLHQHNHPDVLSGRAILVDEKSEALGELGSPGQHKAISRLLPFRNPIIHPASAIKRDSLLRVRGYLGGINCEDLDLWLRMDRLNMSLVVADFIAINYRVSSYQVAGSRIAYADAVGLRLREALFRGSPLFLFGTLRGLIKFYLLYFMGRMK